jgi:hypothetical protein
MNEVPALVSTSPQPSPSRKTELSPDLTTPQPFVNLANLPNPISMRELQMMKAQNLKHTKMQNMIVLSNLLLLIVCTYLFLAYNLQFAGNWDFVSDSDPAEIMEKSIKVSSAHHYINCSKI